MGSAPAQQQSIERSRAVPRTSLGDTAPAPPPSLALTQAAATGSALSAAAKQRKKSALGNTLLGEPKLSQPAAGAKGAPLTLLGY